MSSTRQRGRAALRRLLAPAIGRYRVARTQLDGIDQRSQVINDQVAVILKHLVELEGQMRVDADVLGEFSRASRRIVTELEDRLDDLTEVGAVPRPTEGRAGAHRLVEVAAVTAALAGREPGPTLVLGPGSGDIATTLASIGRATTLIGDDPGAHPMLNVVNAPVDSWSGPAEPLVAAVIRAGFDIDRSTVDLVRGWLAPDGALLLAFAHRDAHGDPGSPADDQALGKALVDWEVTDEQVFVQFTGADAWTKADGRRGDVDWPSVHAAFVLVTATPR